LDGQPHRKDVNDRTLTGRGAERTSRAAANIIGHWRNARIGEETFEPIELKAVAESINLFAKAGAVSFE
jgi:hypothetical protein